MIEMDICPSVEARGRPLVEVRDLTVTFALRSGAVRAVSGISFDVMPGEVLCIIGESGSGKSVTMRTLMRLLPEPLTRIQGSVRVGEYDILSLDQRRLSDVRGSVVSMIFQEPMSALDPTYTIGDQIAEAIVRHQKCSAQDALARALDLLRLVKVPSPERRLRAYPHELSGGLRQRAMIAVALSCKPGLLLADEPTTALDATVQIQVLLLLRKLQQELGMAMIFVTHDLGVAAQIADKVAVMYGGRIVEYGTARNVLVRPGHPYTQAMLASTVNGQPRDRDLVTIGGVPPDMGAFRDGCGFAARCELAIPECSRADIPPLPHAAASHYARCLRAELAAR